MATRFKKLLEPILREECNKAFKRGFEEGVKAGFDQKVEAYENEIELLKNVAEALSKKVNNLQ